MSDAANVEVMRFGPVDERARAIAELVLVDAELEKWSSMATLEHIPPG